MSYPSIWTSEAEPPFDEQPVSPDDEPTLDLAEPPLAAAAREGAAQDEPQGEPGDED